MHSVERWIGGMGACLSHFICIREDLGEPYSMHKRGDGSLGSSLQIGPCFRRKVGMRRGTEDGLLGWKLANDRCRSGCNLGSLLCEALHRLDHGYLSARRRSRWQRARRRTRCWAELEKPKISKSLDNVASRGKRDFAAQRPKCVLSLSSTPSRCAPLLTFHRQHSRIATISRRRTQRLASS